MSIVATASVSDFFGEVVADAMKSRRVEASEGARSYVVALLSDLAKPGSAISKTLERPLTLLLDEALHTEEIGTRFDRLRLLGDGVLYSSGFFADHFEKRGVETSYLIGIGQTAYENAGSLIRTRSSRSVLDDAEDLDIFAELARHFASFVEVIGEVANATIASGVATSRGLVKLYERWLKNPKSEKLADALSSHGFVPPRMGRGGGGGGVLS